MEFKEMTFDEAIQKALDKLGYEQMYEVQEKVIPLLWKQKSVVVQARTGSGKTAAYLLPAIQHISWEMKEPQLLVLTPTRELALQVKEEFDMLSIYRRLRSVAVFGKQPYRFQIQDLKQRTHAVIGTPGRILDHLNRETLSLSGISYVVIDEADEMLNMGFLDTVKNILSFLPENCVFCLCSATMPEEIRKLIAEMLPDSEWLLMEDEQERLPAEKQLVYEVEQEERLPFLAKLLCLKQPESCMIFANTQERVQMICRYLYEQGMDADMLHGGMLQEDRIENIRDFKKGRLRILVCSDVGARGIDVQDVTHIINYDLPKHAQAYIHRIGRTARGEGLQGEVISLYAKKETEKRAALEQELGFLLIPGNREPIDKTSVNEKSIWSLQKPEKEKKDKAEAVRRDAVKLYLSAGKSKKLRAGDIVGAICGIEGIKTEDIGVIEVQEHHSYVDILNGKGEMVLHELSKRTIKKKKVRVMKAKEQ